MISHKPIIICEQKKQSIQEDFLVLGFDINLLEIPLKCARKDLRSILKSLNEDDTVIIMGSSSYCEHMAKITKEILM